MGKSKKLPEGWTNYSIKKQALRDARIFPFKCPLPQSVFINNNLRERWTPDDVIKAIPNLRLVIDLTNKFPAYYNPLDFQSNGIEYIKIALEGHFVPNEEKVLEFLQVVESFLKRNSHNDYIIGVHCTHGVNRTGYVVCRFLVDKLRYNADQALEAFAQCRGHPVERETYIEALHQTHQ